MRQKFLDSVIFLIAIILGSFMIPSAVISYPRTAFGEVQWIQEDDQFPPEVSMIFSDVEAGLSRANIRSFAKHFGTQLYMSTRGSEAGYYSSNQASTILENFFSARRHLNFRFTHFGEADGTPYATGGGSFAFRGNKESFQVYVGLSKQDGRWVISQFNVY